MLTICSFIVLLIVFCFFLNCFHSFQNFSSPTHYLLRMTFIKNFPFLLIDFPHFLFLSNLSLYIVFHFKFRNDLLLIDSCIFVLFYFPLPLTSNHVYQFCSNNMRIKCEYESPTFHFYMYEIVIYINSIQEKLLIININLHVHACECVVVSTDAVEYRTRCSESISHLESNIIE